MALLSCANRNKARHTRVAIVEASLFSFYFLCASAGAHLLREGADKVLEKTYMSQKFADTKQTIDEFSKAGFTLREPARLSSVSPITYLARFAFGAKGSDFRYDSSDASGITRGACELFLSPMSTAENHKDMPFEDVRLNSRYIAAHEYSHCLFYDRAWADLPSSFTLLGPAERRAMAPLMRSGARQEPGDGHDLANLFGHLYSEGFADALFILREAQTNPLGANQIAVDVWAWRVFDSNGSLTLTGMGHATEEAIRAAASFPAARLKKLKPAELIELAQLCALYGASSTISRQAEFLNVSAQERLIPRIQDTLEHGLELLHNDELPGGATILAKASHQRFPASLSSEEKSDLLDSAQSALRKISSLGYFTKLDFTLASGKTIHAIVERQKRPSGETALPSYDGLLGLFSRANPSSSIQTKAADGKLDFEFYYPATLLTALRESGNKDVQEKLRKMDVIAQARSSDPEARAISSGRARALGALRSALREYQVFTSAIGAEPKIRYSWINAAPSTRQMFERVMEVEAPKAPTPRERILAKGA